MKLKTISKKIINNNRVLSIIDQGFVSASNFIIAILVARFLGLEVLGSYIIIFGGIVLMLRLHASIICMPMVTSPITIDGFIKEKKYLVFQLCFILLQLFISPLMLYVFLLLLLKQDPELSLFVSYMLAMVGILTQEFVRRHMISSGRLFMAALFSFTYVLIVMFVVLVIPQDQISLDTFFYTFAVAGVPAIVFYLKLSIKLNSYDFKKAFSELFSHIKNSISLISNNMLQWCSGQYIHYILFIFLGPVSVGLIAAVRNIFGPINILLLSLEGFLPKKFTSAYKVDDSEGLYKEVLFELKLAVLGFVVLGLFLQFSGMYIFQLMYDISSEDAYPVMMLFLFIYTAAFLWRIVMISLRVIGKIRILGAVSIISLLTLVVSSLILIPIYGVLGGVSSMLLSEILVFIVLVVALRHHCHKASK